ncbi:PIN domain-containing protein [Pyrobaculum sp.]|uniref:PIN domain-containing protein n=1 Tax=Pyrobaculum sp. TaxID=2004705 RepID=UPI0038621DB2
MKTALEIADRLKRDEEEIRRRSFDILILAQALNRGSKVFTMDQGFVEFRKKPYHRHSLTKGAER